MAYYVGIYHCSSPSDPLSLFSTYIPARVTAGVTDGVTLGHPCCSVHNCKNTLARQYHRYCPEHAGLRNTCAVKDCIHPNETGFDTCNLEAHRQYELDHRARGRAMPKLKQSARRAAAAQTGDVNTESQQQPSTPSRISGKLTRTWTHNEQLFVWCCGIIASRATLFGAESVSSVKVRPLTIGYAYVANSSLRTF